MGQVKRNNRIVPDLDSYAEWRDMEVTKEFFAFLESEEVVHRAIMGNGLTRGSMQEIGEQTYKNSIYSSFYEDLRNRFNEGMLEEGYAELYPIEPEEEEIDETEDVDKE